MRLSAAASWRLRRGRGGNPVRVKRNRRLLAVVVSSGVVVGGAAIHGIAQDSPTQVGPLESIALGRHLSVFDDVTRLEPADADGGLPTAEADIASGGAYVVASFKNARLLMMPGAGDSPDVCFKALGGIGVGVLCTVKAALVDGRSVLSVSLVRETATTVGTTPRVDFVIVPDEVTRVVSEDGPATVHFNVAILERPHGGPLGRLTYELADGRRVTAAFGATGS